MEPMSHLTWISVVLSGLVATGPSALAEHPAHVDVPQQLPIPSEPVDGNTLGVPTPIEDPSGFALRHIYDRVQAAGRGEGQANIVVYGASHMAADNFTKHLRYRLKRSYGDAGLGFVVPAKPWRNYYNRDVSLSHSDGWDSHWVSRSHNHPDKLYGLAGISFTSSTKDEFISLKPEKRAPFGDNNNRAEIFYWTQPGGGTMHVFVDGKWQADVKTASKQGATAYHVIDMAPGKHSLTVKLKGDGPVTLFGVSLERSGVSGVRMDSMGINGARLADQLDWPDAVFAEHLSKRNPDLIVLAYGTNATGDADEPIARYERRIDKALRRIRSLAPRASCLLVGPSDRPVKIDADGDPWHVTGRPRKRRRKGAKPVALARRPRQPMVIEKQKQVAFANGCAYWDWNAAMGGDLSMLRWTHSEPKMGSRDYIHLTRRGYDRIAELFLDAFMAPLTAGPSKPTPGD